MLIYCVVVPLCSASTLAFYLFKCKPFKADFIPSDKFPVNQDCLHFHLPLPHFKKIYKKMFHCEPEEKKHFLTQRKCSGKQIVHMLLSLHWNCTFMLDWDFEKSFTYFCLTPFEMYKRFIYSSKCNVFKHSTFLGHSLFKQYVWVLWPLSQVEWGVRGWEDKAVLASCGKGNYTFHF